MKAVLLIGLITVILLSGCTQTDSSNNIIPKTYSVEWYGKQSSSGGDRVLDITYIVKKGKITACEGTYTHADNIEACDVSQLENYNAPFYLVKYDSNNLSGSISGKFSYKWKVIT